MALVLVLILVGAASVLTVSAQMSTVMSLRRTRSFQQREILRLSACDSAWHCLPGIASGGERTFGTGEWQTVESIALPSEIRTDVRLRSLPESSNEAILLSLAGYPRANCELLVLESSASPGGTGAVQTVTALLEREKKGKTEVLAWVEQRR